MFWKTKRRRRTEAEKGKTDKRTKEKKKGHIVKYLFYLFLLFQSANFTFLCLPTFFYAIKSHFIAFHFVIRSFWVFYRSLISDSFIPRSFPPPPFSLALRNLPFLSAVVGNDDEWWKGCFWLFRSYQRVDRVNLFINAEELSERKVPNFTEYFLRERVAKKVTLH